jgi:hypothetical protein
MSYLQKIKGLFVSPKVEEKIDEAQELGWAPGANAAKQNKPKKVSELKPVFKDKKVD